MDRPTEHEEPASGRESHAPAGLPAQWRAAYLSVSAVPALACLALALRYGYDVPYWDEWAYVEPISRLYVGEITFADFRVRLNEHVLLVPSLITIPLGFLTYWNLHAEIVLIWLLFAATFALFLRMLLRLDRDAPVSGTLWPAPAIALLMFSFSQHAIWMWGLHVCIALAILLLVVALVLLEREPLGRVSLALAAVCAWAATFSMAGGLAAWPAGLAVLILRPGVEIRRRVFMLFFWIVNGLAAPIVFLAAAADNARIGPESLPDPVAYVLYVLAYVGGPVVPMFGPLAAGLGAAAILMMLAWTASQLARPAVERPAAFPMAAGFATAAVAAGAMTALKHAPEGVANAVSSRFLPWPTLFWCAILLALYRRVPAIAKAPRLVRATVALALVSILAGCAFGAYRADERYDAFVLGRRALLAGDLESPDLAYLHPDPETVRRLRPRLVENRLTAFRNAK